MALEIERKFLVVGDGWRAAVSGLRYIRQAYLSKNGRLSIRIRIDGHETASLTIKTAEPGIERQEFEYQIPVQDAEELLKRCEGSIITKVRHLVPLCDHVWEVDVFEGENTGLVIAEIELEDAADRFPYPIWIGREVTADRKYYNSDLARHPFQSWPRSDLPLTPRDVAVPPN